MTTRSKSTKAASTDSGKTATGRTKAQATGKAAARSKGATAGQKSGLVPAGDVRLTANIRSDLHIALKVRAAQEQSTVGELIEKWIESWR